MVELHSTYQHKCSYFADDNAMHCREAIVPHGGYRAAEELIVHKENRRCDEILPELLFRIGDMISRNSNEELPTWEACLSQIRFCQIGFHRIVVEVFLTIELAVCVAVLLAAVLPR